MPRKNDATIENAVNLSALDLFANAVGALAFLLLLVLVTTINMVEQSMLHIMTTRMPDAMSSREYIAVIAAQGGVAPYQWSIQSGSLPEGIRLDAARGELTGIPSSAAGITAYTCVLRVTDSAKHSATARYTLRVLPQNVKQQQQRDPLVLLTHGPLPDATIGETYDLFLAARGGSGRYTWSATGLPHGMSLQPYTGRISGSPVTGGTFQLTFAVNDRDQGGGDAGQAIASAQLQVVSQTRQHVQPAAQEIPVRITTPSLPAAVVGQRYEVMLAGTGVPPYSWAAENLPPGLRINTDGILSGTPAQTAKQVLVTVSLKDSRGRYAPLRIYSMVVTRQQQGLIDKGRHRGIFWWLGFLLIGLVYVGGRYLLQMQFARKIHSLMIHHNVTLIEKPEDPGTASARKISYLLNGPPDAVEQFKAAYMDSLNSSKHTNTLMLVLLIVALLVYAIIMLR